MAAPRMRIGLLGGSFNPAHEGHRHISQVALARLGLDQVWWLVSPGNPLKDASELPSVKKRVAAAREVAQHPRIAVTGFEDAHGFVHTIDTIRFLKRRFPDVHFVWLMGADNLAGFHRWQAWETLFRLVPIAVFDRPGFGLKARAGKAARRFAAAAVDDSDAGGLTGIVPPAWTFLTIPLLGLSSTGLRSAAGTDKAHKKKSGKEKAANAAKKKDAPGQKKAKRH